MVLSCFPNEMEVCARLGVGAFNDIERKFEVMVKQKAKSKMIEYTKRIERPFGGDLYDVGGATSFDSFSIIYSQINEKTTIFQDDSILLFIVL
jgi:hypothetical protein